MHSNRSFHHAQIAVPEAREANQASGDTSQASSQPVLAAALALLAQLEQSLAAGQRALLARNLEAIENATAQQKRLLRELAVFWSANRSPREAVELDPEGDLRHGAAADTLLAGGWRHNTDFQAAVRRVLQLGRVQAALLARAQQSLKVISRLAAGPQTSYEAPRPNQNPNPNPNPGSRIPIPKMTDATPASEATKPASEENACRA